MDSYVGPNALVELFTRALRLDPALYREVTDAPGATKLCIGIALVAGIASAPVIGPSEGIVLPVAIVVGILITLGILLIESVLVWGLCRLVLRNDRSFGAVLRPLALAHAPRVAFLLVPLIGYPLGLAIVIRVWLLAAFVVALEAIAARGWVVAVVLAIVVGALRWLAS